jgi:glutaredoxin
VLLAVCLAWAPLCVLAIEEGRGSDPAVLEVYVREGCPHCADAKRYLAGLQLQRPQLQIVYRAVDCDPAARLALTRLTQQHGVWPPGVPTFVIGGALRIGFDTPERSGPELLAMIDAATAASGERGPAIPVPARACEDNAATGVESRLFGRLDAGRIGLPLFTLALGLLDGFNPCAMWVLLFLLSLLIRLQDRRRMAIIAGCFVLTGGLVYFAFMAAWLNLFLAVGLSERLRLLLAAVALLIGAFNLKDFFAFGRGPSLSIPPSAKPGIYARTRAVLQARSLPAAMAAVALLAAVVNLVELLCTAGLPAIYTAVLTQQALSPAAHYGYLGLYILGYLTDDGLMVGIAVATLGSRKLTERGGRWLKLLSGAVMLALGLLMAVRPEWLM